MIGRRRSCLKSVILSHVTDLIACSQEVDIEAFPKARVFVDDIDNALISGDLSIPIAEGVFSADMIEGDLFDLCQNPNFLRSDEDITIYKNAGGAYLDLIVSQRVIDSLSL